MTKQRKKTNLFEKKEFKVQELFADYVNNFWKREEMSKPMTFINEGWGGAGLCITNIKNYTSTDDTYIYTEDYRFCLFTKEVYKVCQEITSFVNKESFFEIIGNILDKHQKIKQPLEMNKEIFEELVKGIKYFIDTEVEYLTRI